MNEQSFDYLQQPDPIFDGFVQKDELNIPTLEHFDNEYDSIQVTGEINGIYDYPNQMGIPPTLINENPPLHDEYIQNQQNYFQQNQLFEFHPYNNQNQQFNNQTPNIPYQTDNQDITIINPQFYSSYNNQINQSNLIYNVNNPSLEQSQINLFDNPYQDESQQNDKPLRKTESIQISPNPTNTQSTKVKYDKLQDKADDTKNLLRNFGSKLIKEISDSKNIEERNQGNQWIMDTITQYAQKHIRDIKNVDKFTEDFFEKYSNIGFSNFDLVRKTWKISKNSNKNEIHLVNCFREVSFHFFSKIPLYYMYKQSNKMIRKNQRETHLKYLHVFLKGIIYPNTFSRFKEPKQKQKKNIYTIQNLTM